MLSTLVEIVKTVEEEDRVTALPASQGEEDKDELSSSSPVEKMNCFGEVMGVGGEGGVGGDAGEGVLELDEEVEGRLCTLWDASMNTVRMLYIATVNIWSSYLNVPNILYFVRLLPSLSTSKKA